VATVLSCQFLQTLPQGLVAVFPGLVAQHAGADSNQATSLAFAQAFILQLPHAFAPGRHGHYFPRSTSRINLQHGLGQQLLELGILNLQPLEALSV